MNNGEQVEKFDCWAIVELFGHQKIAGRVREATIAGGAFIRVDVPQIKEQKPFTRLFGPGAIYSINPTTEEIATAAAEYHVQPPVSRYELPRLAEKATLAPLLTGSELIDREDRDEDDAF